MPTGGDVSPANPHWRNYQVVFGRGCHKDIRWLILGLSVGKLIYRNSEGAYWILKKVYKTKRLSFDVELFVRKDEIKERNKKR